MQQQLSFKLQELPSSGRQWDLEIPQTVFENAQIGEVDAPSRLCKDVYWKGDISSQGRMFTLQGTWRIELIRQCVRCNIEFPLPMEGSFCRYFQFGNCVSEADKSEVFECLPSPGLVDLVDVLREEIWLAWKPMVVCRESCKGICQQCGKDLNRNECSCSQNDDNNPFAALRNIRFDS
ncbi:MAG: DUF177 domain-containing protein [Mariprofundaceae bacterium]